MTLIPQSIAVLPAAARCRTVEFLRGFTQPGYRFVKFQSSGPRALQTREIETWKP